MKEDWYGVDVVTWAVSMVGVVSGGGLVHWWFEHVKAQLSSALRLRPERTSTTLDQAGTDVRLF